MMTVVEQLVFLTYRHLPQYAKYAGADLQAIFERASKEGRLALAMQGSLCWGFVTWTWIRTPADIASVLLGERTHGPVLFVLDCVAAAPGILWVLKAQLPKHHWMVWLHENRVHAPKGWPQEVSTPCRS